MICSNCGYDRWDGESTHDYAGRVTAGLKCYGPKVRRYAVIPAGTLKAGSTFSVTAVGAIGPAVGVGPPVPESAATGDVATRKERLARALDSIEGDLKLKRGSELAQPDPADRRGKRKAKPGRFSRKAKKVRR